MAGLWGIASHGGGILSRYWLIMVEAPGCLRGLPGDKKKLHKFLYTFHRCLLSLKYKSVVSTTFLKGIKEPGS